LSASLYGRCFAYVTSSTGDSLRNLALFSLAVPLKFSDGFQEMDVKLLPCVRFRYYS